MINGGKSSGARKCAGKNNGGSMNSAGKNNGVKRYAARNSGGSRNSAGKNKCGGGSYFMASSTRSQAAWPVASGWNCPVP